MCIPYVGARGLFLLASSVSTVVENPAAHSRTPWGGIGQDVLLAPDHDQPPCVPPSRGVARGGGVGDGFVTPGTTTSPRAACYDSSH